MDDLQRFTRAVRDFRAALRNDEADLVEWTRLLRNAVAQVYVAAAVLPPGDVTTDDGPPDRVPTELKVSAELEVAAELRARLGGNDRYRTIWDATGAFGNDVEPIESSLSLELAEIDSDLHEALAWLEQPHADVLWDLRFAFEQHWGQHAVNVLRPLHVLAAGYVG
jgi:uncharacterized protein DUF5063